MNDKDIALGLAALLVENEELFEAEQRQIDWLTGELEREYEFSEELKVEIADLRRQIGDHEREVNEYRETFVPHHDEVVKLRQENYELHLKVAQSLTKKPVFFKEGDKVRVSEDPFWREAGEVTREEDYSGRFRGQIVKVLMDADNDGDYYVETESGNSFYASPESLIPVTE